MTEPFSGMAKVWKDLREQKAAQLAIELNVELDAAADFYERTGRSMHTLGSVEQRKIIENWKEDHQ